MRASEHMSPFADRRRGAALFIAIMVLAGLFFLALPFAVFMRLQHSAATQALQTTRARYGEMGALNQSRALLYQGWGNVEDPNPLTPPPHAFPFDNPDVDTLWEFHTTLRTQTTGDILASGGDPDFEVNFGVEWALGLPNDGDPDTVDGYIRVGEEWMGYTDINLTSLTSPTGTLTVPDSQRGLFSTTAASHPDGSPVSFFPDLELWHADIRDPQARINVNTAPYQVIVNLLGYLRIWGNSPEDAPTGDDAYDFPTDTQQAIASAVSSYRLYYSYWNNNAEDDGDYIRFPSVNAVKNISLAPWFQGQGGPFEALDAADFDRLRRYITVHSDLNAPDIWPWLGITLWPGSSGYPTGADVNLAEPEDTLYWAARLNDASRVPVGSVIALDNGTDQPEYRLVVSVSGGGTTLVDDITDVTTGWVEVNDVSGIRLLHSSDTPAITLHTPAFLYLEDGGFGEWIAVSDVDVDGPTNKIYISERQIWNSASVNPDPVTATLAGNTVGWRYDAGAGYSSNLADPDQLGNYAPAVANIYRTDETHVLVERRHAININTVDNTLVLTSLLHGLSNPAVPASIDATEAAAIATAMLDYTSANVHPDDPVGPPFEFFIPPRNENWVDGVDINASGADGALTPSSPWNGDPQAELDDFFAALGPTGAGLIDADQVTLLQQNFQDEHPTLWPAVSTIPLRFNSGEVVGVEALGVVDNPARTPVGQSPLLALERGRHYDITPPLAGLYWTLRTQKDFLTDGGAGLLIALTNPLMEGLAGALLAAHPDYDNADPGVGTVAPGLDAPTLRHALYLPPDTPLYTTAVLGFHGSGGADFDLDYSIADDEDELTADLERTAWNTSAHGLRKQRLRYPTRHAEPVKARHLEASAFHRTMQPFAVEFWIRPAHDDPLSRQLLFDIGPQDVANASDSDAKNQVRVYLENEGIVVRIDEPIYEANEGYAGYVTARTSGDFEFAADVWHHVAIAVAGPFRDEIAIFVDGIYDTDMEWLYNYLDPVTGVAGAKSAAEVVEGTIMPLGMRYPNKDTDRTTVTLGRDDEFGFWPAGSMEIGVEDAGFLPPKGAVVIGRADYAYAYEDIWEDQPITVPDGPGGTTTLTVDLLDLVKPLDEPHYEGEQVVMMLPLCRTVRHTSDDPVEAGTGYRLPADTVMVMKHAELTEGNGSYEQVGELVVDGEAGPSLVHPEMLHYVWLAVGPGEAGAQPFSVLSDTELVHADADAYKFVGGYTEAVLGGSLPNGGIGEAFGVGGDRRADKDKVGLFQGELDELRITALPLALTAGDWTGESATVWTWRWEETDPFFGETWPHMEIEPGVDFTMTAEAPVHLEGGYFLAQGRAYSYESYDTATHRFLDIKKVAADLTALPEEPAGLYAGHGELRPIIPVNWLATTTLAGSITDTEIPVSDASQFPAQGYAQIGRDIIAYDGVDLSVTPHRLTRSAILQKTSLDSDWTYNLAFNFPTSVSPEPRKELDPHSAGQQIVRHLPVRHLDRYRSGVEPAHPNYPWDVHTNYDDADLAKASMLSYAKSWSASVDLSMVWWRLKEPLEDNQRVAVLVGINDPGTGWENVLPQPHPDATETWLYGVVQDGTEQVIWIDEAAGQYIAIDAQGGAFWFGQEPAEDVEVRFYFDLGFTHPYAVALDTNTGLTEGWERMIEVDEVGIQATPQSSTFQ